MKLEETFECAFGAPEVVDVWVTLFARVVDSAVVCTVYRRSSSRMDVVIGILTGNRPNVCIRLALDPSTHPPPVPFCPHCFARRFDTMNNDEDTASAEALGG